MEQQLQIQTAPLPISSGKLLSGIERMRSGAKEEKRTFGTLHVSPFRAIKSPPSLPGLCFDLGKGA